MAYLIGFVVLPSIAYRHCGVKDTLQKALMVRMMSFGYETPGYV